jgi:hypothetical protein
MHKKIIGACLALAAFAAFAVLPAVASASPELTHPTGKTVPVGTKILGTLVGGTSTLTDTSGNPLVHCTTATMTGEVTQNSGTSIQGKITSAIFGGTGPQEAMEPHPECTGTFGNASVTALVSSAAPWCLKSTGGDGFSVSGGACPGGGAIKFILKSTTVGECEYESTKAVTGTFATHPTDAVLTVTESGFTKIRGGFFCPSSGKLDMSFTLETHSPTVEPIYIS